MESFAVATHHFKIPNTSTVTLSSGNMQWDSTTVKDIVENLFNSWNSIGIASSDTSTDHSQSSSTAQAPGNPSVESHWPPCVLLVVGDSRDFIETNDASSRLRSAR